MSFQQIPGGGVWVPNELCHSANPPGITTSATIQATGDKFAWHGRVSFKERSVTKNIQTVGFRFGVIVKAGGSGLSVSLQGVSSTAGPPMQPDGVKGQTVAIANGNAAFASNQWMQTGNLSSTRTVAYGDLVSVVIEFDTNGRLGSDSFIIGGISMAAGGLSRQHGFGVSSAASVWTVFLAAPLVVLGFDDGTFGTLYGGVPMSATSSNTYGSNSNPDEYALGFQLPFPAKICGFEALMGVGAGADFSVILYSGTTPLQTVSVSNRMTSVVSNARVFYIPLPETALAANALYYISIRPDTAAIVSFYYVDVANAAHLQAHGGGPSWVQYSRVDGGAWSANTVRRPMMSIELSAFDDGLLHSTAMIV